MRDIYLLVVPIQWILNIMRTIKFLIFKKLKKKYYKKNFQFVAVSGWLKKAENSNVLNQFKIKKIDNNIGH